MYLQGSKYKIHKMVISGIFQLSLLNTSIYFHFYILPETV